jgi:hypothetical protein
MNKAMRLFIPAILAAALTAASQTRPQSACAFDGFSADPKLAEVTKAATGYSGCAAGKNCLPTKLSAGDTATIYHVDGDWTCAYLQQRNGAGPGWVSSKDIREVVGDPAPTLDAWVGAWTKGDGRIVITASSGKLHLAGEGEWHGAAGVVHTGDFEGDAEPNGNHLHFVEGNADSCTVDLTLLGKYIVVNDNDRCGGMNVRFWGVWKRAAK